MVVKEAGACSLKVCKLNALNCYEKSLICIESLIVNCLCVSVNACNVYGSNSLDSVVKNLNGGVLNLVSVLVDILFTCYLNSHTNCKAKLGYGILFKSVDVVTALAGLVVKVDVVLASAACRLRNDCRNDTLYDNGITLSCCVVLSKSGVGVNRGNVAVEGNALGVALRVGNGCSKSIVHVSLGSFGKNYGNLIFVAFLGNDSNSCVVCSPNDRQNSFAALDGNLCKKVIVSGGLSIKVLVKRVDLCNRVLCVGLVVGSGCAALVVIACIVGIVVVVVLFFELYAEPTANGLLYSIEYVRGSILNCIDCVCGGAGCHRSYCENHNEK